LWPRIVPSRLWPKRIIVVTATTSKHLVFDGSLLRPGTHVNAVGSNSLAKAEVDVTAVSRADRVIVDSIEQSKVESGDLLGPIDLRKIRLGAGGGNCYEVVPAGIEGSVRAEITLFKSNGLALEDIAAASLVYERARNGDGRELGYGGTNPALGVPL